MVICCLSISIFKHVNFFNSVTRSLFVLGSNGKYILRTTEGKKLGHPVTEYMNVSEFYNKIIATDTVCKELKILS
jgi:hypothetical protein